MHTFLFIKPSSNTRQWKLLTFPLVWKGSSPTFPHYICWLWAQCLLCISCIFSQSRMCKKFLSSPVQSVTIFHSTRHQNPGFVAYLGENILKSVGCMSQYDALRPFLLPSHDCPSPSLQDQTLTQNNKYVTEYQGKPKKKYKTKNCYTTKIKTIE